MKDVEKRRKVSKRSVDVTSQPSNSFARLLAASSPYFNSTPIQETPQDRRYATIKFSLLALNTLTIMDSEMDGELKFFIILQNLIHAFQRCHSDPDNMLFGLTLSAYTMARFGEWGYWVARQLYNVTCRMRHKCTDAIVPNFRIYAALTLSFDRSPKMALGMYLENERFWDERKVARECYKLKPLMFGASVLAGKLRMMTEGTPDALVREMMVTERMWTVGVCSVLMFEAMYAGDVERVERFGGMAGVVAEGFGDQIRYVFGYINGMMEVLVHLAKGEGYEKEFCERMEIYADNSSKLQMEENQVYMIFHSFVLLMGCTAIMNRVLKGRGGGALSISTTALQQSIAQVLKRVPVVRASFQLVIARHVYTACGRVLEGKGYKEAGWFKAMFCRKPYAGQMDEGGEFMGLGGFVAGAVGHLSQNEVERRRFAMRAAGLFRGMQAAACERWALMALQ
ncbi:hypothetical protein BC829DRAFT_296403 [Chytridium lagenaria]|nr:hypothetical protein BC829DRAFT_296403 [Chytridium lagenaria]